MFDEYLGFLLMNKALVEEFRKKKNNKDKEYLNMVQRTTQIITQNCARIKFSQAWFIIVMRDVRDVKDGVRPTFTPGPRRDQLVCI